MSRIQSGRRVQMNLSAMVTAVRLTGLLAVEERNEMCH